MFESVLSWLHFTAQTLLLCLCLNFLSLGCREFLSQVVEFEMDQYGVFVENPPEFFLDSLDIKNYDVILLLCVSISNFEYENNFIVIQIHLSQLYCGVFDKGNVDHTADPIK